MPLGRLNAPSTTRWTAAGKYGAGRPAAAWGAGDQARTGNVLRFPVAGPIPLGTAPNPHQTPLYHGSRRAARVSGPPASGGRSGASADPAAGVASAAPVPALSQHAETNTATNHRVCLPGLTVRYTIAASLSDCHRWGQDDATLRRLSPSSKPPAGRSLR